MSDSWISILVALCGTSLAVEIYKTIVSAVQKYHEKKNNIKSVPQQVQDITTKIDRLTESTDKQFVEVKSRLDKVEKMEGDLAKIEKTLNRNGQGTGISLSVNKAILEGLKRHGYDLNGEGKEAEKELNDYLLHNTQEGLRLG